MNEEQNLVVCPRCQSENEIHHNFCWLCGIGLNQQRPGSELSHSTTRRRGPSVAASVGTGLAGVLAGALGGIIVGLLIVVAFVLTVLNAISEFFESCAGMLIFMSLTFSAAAYSVISWLIWITGG